jgi:hypothetical protein
MVGGKTIIEPDGSAIIFMNASLLIAEGDARAEANPERMFSHECWHVVLAHEEEDPSSSLRRLDLTADEEHCLSLAAIAVEEFRIESHLWRGRLVSSSRSGDTPDYLLNVRDKVAEGLSNPDFRIAARVALAAHGELNTHLAYVAAEPPEQRPLAHPLTNSADWDRLVGPFWTDMLPGFDQFPDAAGRIGEAALDALLLELGNLERDWLVHFGVKLSDQGGLYLDFLRHDF